MPLAQQGTLQGIPHDTCNVAQYIRFIVVWPHSTHILIATTGFDGVKIDSCGNQRDMTEWAAEFAELARGNRELLVESCGNGPRGTDPKDAAYTGADRLGLAPSWEAMVEGACPFSFYRCG